MPAAARGYLVIAGSMEAAARRGAKCMEAASTSSSPHKPFQSKHPSSYVPQIKGLKIRNPLTYEDSGWIELGMRTPIVGVRYGSVLAGVLMPAAALSGHLI